MKNKYQAKHRDPQGRRARQNSLPEIHPDLQGDGKGFVQHNLDEKVKKIRARES